MQNIIFFNINLREDSKNLYKCLNSKEIGSSKCFVQIKDERLSFSGKGLRLDVTIPNLLKLDSCGTPNVLGSVSEHHHQ